MHLPQLQTQTHASVVDVHDDDDDDDDDDDATKSSSNLGSNCPERANNNALEIMYLEYLEWSDQPWEFPISAWRSRAFHHYDDGGKFIKPGARLSSAG
ncbi:hypothetical protein M5D96_006833 [Drosophila gunungcola]|uniref:Uncharacterized protein n=1 Tax=Drosophila gunungcola TaxID=103775 RepID=A0A9P9YQ80_9MUSC|nr:hypothetical protein M5D96_006833 [Drosophila gunungcola]